MCGYVFEFDGKYVNVFYVFGKMLKIFKNVGNDFCNVLLVFFIRFEIRLILLKLNGD